MDMYVFNSIFFIIYNAYYRDNDYRHVNKNKSFVFILLRPRRVRAFLILTLSRAQHHARNACAPASVVREEMNKQITKFNKRSGELYLQTVNSKN